MYTKIALLALLSQEAFCLAGENPPSDKIEPENVVLKRPKFKRGISVMVRSPQIDDFSPIRSARSEEKKESPTPALEKEDAFVASLLRLALSPGGLQRRASPPSRPVVAGLLTQSPESDEVDDEGIYVPWYFSGEPAATKPDPKKKEGE